MPIAKSDLEQMAIEFRHDAGVYADDVPFDPLQLEIEGIEILGLDDIEGLDPQITSYLKGEGAQYWSAMTVPCDANQERWVIVLNREHDKKRQRPSLMEELWHIMLGHKLTKITKIGSQYGRSFDSDDEHDAYYAGAATLLPAAAIRGFVDLPSRNIADFSDRFGVSRELIEYRIKRLGLWRRYMGHDVKMRPADA
jgi:hypothetical protein